MVNYAERALYMSEGVDKRLVQITITKHTRIQFVEKERVFKVSGEFPSICFEFLDQLGIQDQSLNVQF